MTQLSSAARADLRPSGFEAEYMHMVRTDVAVSLTVQQEYIKLESVVESRDAVERLVVSRRCVMFERCAVHSALARIADLLATLVLSRHHLTTSTSSASYSAHSSPRRHRLRPSVPSYPP